MAKGIRALLDTVMQALPQVGNLGLLFFLLFFIFAALGVELFGRLECSDEMPCQGLGEHAHFANFGMAFLTLFRVATGDNWNGIMKDTLRDNCDDNADCVKNCCVSTIIAPIFFVIFVLMAQFVLVNVVVAVLMKHLEESHKQMEDELDMEVELERELQQEQEELEEELCLQALESEIQLENRVKRPLEKVLSLPANFAYYSDKTSKDSSSFQIDESNVRRGSSISYQSPYQIHRRQTFHAQGPLPTYGFPVTGFPNIYITDQEKLLRKKSHDSEKLENIPDRQKLSRRMSSIDHNRRSSLSAVNSRRGSLFKPKPELQTLIGLSKSAGLMPCPSPKQLLSLTELAVSEKEREKRILRKALSMENRTSSEDISPECLTPGILLVPPPHPCEKILLRTEDEIFKKSERHPLFRQQKSTEGMEKIEESFTALNIPTKKILQEKRKSIFKQISLDSKQLSQGKTKEVCPEEIAMVVQERRTPYLRELRSKTHDFCLDETPFASQTEEHGFKLPIRRQTTTPISEVSLIKRQKPNLIRQETNSAENLVKGKEKDDLQLSVLEKRGSLQRKSTQSSNDDADTAETSLSAQIIMVSSNNEKGFDANTWKERKPYDKDDKLLGVSAETTTSISSNSTTLTTLRSDSIVSEDTEKDNKMK